MTKLKIAVVSPCGTFLEDRLMRAYANAFSMGIELIGHTQKRIGVPSFINGSKADRLKELIAAESLPVDAIWCARGGCGAIELWHDYQKEFYQTSLLPMVGYSDITILHFMRFYRAGRIGIHGPIFFDIEKGQSASIEAVALLLNKHADNLIYPALKPLNHFLSMRLSGELLAMNLAALESIIGGFEPSFLRGKILALEDVNEPHYRVYRSLHHLKNVGALVGVKALLIGHFGEDRDAIIKETIVPIADELGIPLFDWPIFGHDKPNWPLLFGAKSTINRVDEHFFTLTYDEQHDHTPIHHDYY